MRDCHRQAGAPGSGKPATSDVRVVEAVGFRKLVIPYRTGWAQACKRLAANDGDVLVLQEFANEADVKLKW